EWHPIDPQAWVTGRGYNQREPAASLADFLSERSRSLDWLRSLTNPDWNQGRQAPWGLLRAGDMLASWAAHDLLHTRQLVELHWAYGLLQNTPFDARYAGDW
ncbi:DinB family protein, partial [bacterium]|nr:DinB family protein [bacterium]